MFYPRLNSIRALAVLMVLAHHYFPSIKIFGIGDIGVNLFFFLSGYLISGRLIDKSNTGSWGMIKSFYLNRSLRIFPIYYLYLIVGILLSSSMGVVIGWNFVSYLTYTSNIYFYQINSWDGVFSHLWSLAVEEQFYILWPLMMVFYISKNLAKRLIILSFLSILSTCLLVYYLPDRNIHLLLVSCVYKFSLGALSGTIITRFHDIFLKYLSLLMLYMPLGLTLAAYICFLNYRFGFLISDVLLYFVFLIFVFTSITPNIRGWLVDFLSNSKIQYLGLISYGVYMYHLIVPWFLDFLVMKLNLGFDFLNFNFIRAFLSTIFTICLAHFSYRYFETFFYKYKSK